MVIPVEIRSDAASRQIIVADPELLVIPRVRKVLHASGMRIVASGDATRYQELNVLPSQNLAVVLAPFPSLSGLSAAAHVKTQIENIRTCAPFTPIAFVTEKARMISEACLPAGVHFVTAHDLELPRIVLAGDTRRHERSWEARNGRLMLGSAQAFHEPAPVKLRWTARHTTANFNLKHPSMVVPFALAAKQSGLDVFCEVSAQEIALYHGLCACEGVSKALSKALATLRRYVDDANAAFGTALKIHLDHCDDLDLLLAACDAGFDTVMADGSGLGLEQNIAFTNAASRIALPFEVPVEGEVGSIDGGDRWGKTRLEDFGRFVTATDIDLVGVSLGQFHGFDYGFAATRARLAEIEDIDRGVGRDRHALIEACVETRARLRDRGFPPSAAEFRLLRVLTEGAMSSVVARSPDELLDTARAGATLYVRSFVDDVEDLWLSKRKSMTMRKQQLWQATFAAHRHHDVRYGLFDHALLGEFVRRLDGARPALVVHGGSSIARSDLECLPGTGVARVNFGTEVFRYYVTALTEEAPGQQPAAMVDYAALMPFIEGATAGWEAWLERPPSWAASYAESLVANYIRPLAGITGAEYGESHDHL
jgi:fructose/tagatose bisphosphate aldolase